MRVALGLSGGIDSAVAAIRLLEEGHTPVAFTLRNTPLIPDAQTLNRASQVATKLGIEHYILETCCDFEQEVIKPFAEAYASGLTPNPCACCNPRFKFAQAYAFAQAHNCAKIATGHYACVSKTGLIQMASDIQKDQSYFLYRLGPKVRSMLMFPLAHITKVQVKEIATKHGLEFNSIAESNDVCFLPTGSRTELLEHYASCALKKGNFVSTSGKVLGTHDGIGLYTIGQRKGLGIGGLREPLYVSEIHAEANEIVLASHDELYLQDFKVSDISLHAPFVCEEPVDCTIKTRYRMESVNAQVSLDIQEEILRVHAFEPIFACAPGQSLVCYDTNGCIIAGGIICKYAKSSLK